MLRKEVDSMDRNKKIPLVTLILLGVNVLVFFFVEFQGSSYDSDFMIRMGALYDPLFLQDHEFYRLITHFFFAFRF